MNKFLLIIFQVATIIYFTKGQGDAVIKVSDNRINQYLIDGCLDSLLGKEDTLVIHFNLSGCTARRHDKIRLYKNEMAIFIIPEITYEKGEIIQGKAKMYTLSKNDSLSIENFISETHRTLSEEPDSLREKTAIISIGVLNKWGKKYFSKKMTDEYSRIYDLYLKTMHEIFPDMEEYKSIVIEIIDMESND